MPKETKIRGLSKFQIGLLSNLVEENQVLRHGTSKAVQDLIKRGFVEKSKDEKTGAVTFVATKEAKSALK